jgi:hypothetical protein
MGGGETYMLFGIYCVHLRVARIERLVAIASMAASTALPIPARVSWACRACFWRVAAAVIFESRMWRYAEL